MVDSGNDIFILSSGLGAKTLSQDKSKMLFFEDEPFKLVEVDLNNLKLVGKTPFQKKGLMESGLTGLDFSWGRMGIYSLRAITSREYLILQAN